MKGFLQLENGMTIEGKLFGYINERIPGEVVFNTSMTGYQEVLTDPSYYGQIVTMTYPLIGNYGINFDYEQSKGCKVKGFIVKEYCTMPNNFNNEMTLTDYLENERITGLCDVDTKKLTKILRNQGVMRGLITTFQLPRTKLLETLDEFDNTKCVSEVSTKSVSKYNGVIDKHVVIIDCGIKTNIVEMFKARGVSLTIVPYNTDYQAILDLKPSAVFISNGPGDPIDCKETIGTVKNLIGKLPLIGICLGHQIVSLALGGKTKKLKFGHRGANHPVKDLTNGKVFITSQNHGYVVDSLPEGVEITHININDKSIEGMKDEKNKIFTVQFHPEACPGPYEAVSIFDEFIKMIG